MCHVSPVSLVSPVSPVSPVSHVGSVSPVSPVSPVSLAHLWVLFGVIVCLFLLLTVHALKTSYFRSLTFKKTSAGYFDFEQFGIWSESF